MSLYIPPVNGNLICLNVSLFYPLGDALNYNVSVTLPEEFYDLEVLTPGFNVTGNTVYWLNKPDNIAVRFRVIFKATLDFLEGWNLVGLPFDPVNASSVEELFGEKLQYVKAIYGYQNGTWLYWLSSGVPNTLTQLRGGAGYWVLASQEFNLTIRGTCLATLNLTKGWNLVALPTIVSMATLEFLRTYGGSAIYAYVERTGEWAYYILSLIHISEPTRPY